MPSHLQTGGSKPTCPQGEIRKVLWSTCSPQRAPMLQSSQSIALMTCFNKKHCPNGLLDQTEHQASPWGNMLFMATCPEEGWANYHIKCLYKHSQNFRWIIMHTHTIIKGYMFSLICFFYIIHWYDDMDTRICIRIHTYHICIYWIYFRIVACSQCMSTLTPSTFLTLNLCWLPKPWGAQGALEEGLWC